jgi:hypothetical protein
MTLKEAKNRMQHEMQFLGLNWADLEHLLQEKPGIFSYKTILAYDVIKEQA